jgi:hypothetical protein
MEAGPKPEFPISNRLYPNVRLFVLNGTLTDPSTVVNAIVGLCTSVLRIIPQPEKRVVYHRFLIWKGKRHGRRPAFPRAPAPGAAVAVRDLVLAVVKAPRRAMPSPWPARQAISEACDTPEAVSGPHHKALCAACTHTVQAHAAKPPPAPPPLLTSPRGRRRQVDIQHQFCPAPSCRYYGWMGRGNIRANGHPSGGHGGSGNVWSVAPTFSRPTGPCSTAKARPRSCSYT